MKVTESSSTDSSDSSSSDSEDSSDETNEPIAVVTIPPAVVVGVSSLGMVNFACTELVDGILASNGTVKLPDMLPDASGVRVDTVRAVPVTVYSMVTDGLESDPVLVLSAG